MCESPGSTVSAVVGSFALVGLGAGLMYFLDPDRGRRRRALVRDQFVHALSEIDDAIGVVSRDLSNRSRGMWENTSSLPRRLTGETVPDEILAQRVRSKLGRYVSHPRSIRVEAREGHVTLSGPILASEARGWLTAVGRVQGVRGVDDRLERHEPREGISALQEGRPRAGERSELCQQNWSPTARLLVGSTGALLLATGVVRRGVAGLTLGAMGTALMARAGTNIPTRHWFPSVIRPEAIDQRGEPGGGRGRIDKVGRTGVYPASGPFPPGEAPVRTPESFVHGQRDEEGREVEGGSEPIYFHREALLGGENPRPSGEPSRTESWREEGL
jgi:hypothetical protein